MVECELCKKSFRKIIGNHLEKIHSMKFHEYVEKFPTALTMPKDMREEEQKRLKDSNPMHDVETKGKVSKALKGRTFSVEHRSKISKSRIGKPTRFGEHTIETKNKISLALKGKMAGEKNPMFGISLVASAETIQKRKDTKTKRQKEGKIYKTLKGKKLNLTKEQRLNRSIKRSLYLKNNPTNKSNTDIEIKFKEYIVQLGINYEQQYILNTEVGSWLFDFYLPSTNMLVEIDGEYWHSSKYQINRDILKEKTALEHNFCFVRISSKNLDFDIIHKPLDFIKEHNREILERRLQNVN